MYPTKEQQRLLERQLAACRWLYTHLLAKRRAAWDQRQESVRLYDQHATLPALKAERPALAGVPSQVVQNVAVRIDLAFTAVFRRGAAGEPSSPGPARPAVGGRDAPPASPSRQGRWAASWTPGPSACTSCMWGASSWSPPGPGTARPRRRPSRAVAPARGRWAARARAPPRLRCRRRGSRWAVTGASRPSPGSAPSRRLPPHASSGKQRRRSSRPSAASASRSRARAHGPRGARWWPGSRSAARGGGAISPTSTAAALWTRLT